MQLFFIILGMAMVTFIPRLLPVFIIDKLSLPSWASKWLKTIPYAALGALIFPGILTVESSLPIIGFVGGIAAMIIAFFKLHVIYVIFGSILTVMLMKFLLL
ncbi:branched-chain amino acid transport [Clostridium aceticum]|uniref:Branched-chain amino acid transport n=1 Tax=Clostridium aceticum TaxID=84022 RepID=A0A0D8IEW2_9CLOT|nr:AzlD domain-containing protein [Clostridium aceticum]AKL94127.1 branched-chain amino acid transport [Clostridium aceticum]KJF28522.1 branched-chain amino acid transporter [Clostridium aceticum]